MKHFKKMILFSALWVAILAHGESADFNKKSLESDAIGAADNPFLGEMTTQENAFMEDSLGTKSEDHSNLFLGGPETIDNQNSDAQVRAEEEADSLDGNLFLGMDNGHTTGDFGAEYQELSDKFWSAKRQDLP